MFFEDPFDRGMVEARDEELRRGALSTYNETSKFAVDNSVGFFYANNFSEMRLHNENVA